METTEVQTAGGYTALIKRDLTYGEFSQIQQAMAERIQIDPTASSYQVSGALMAEMNRKAIQLLLVSLKDKAGADVNLDDIPARDGMEIVERVNAVWAAAQGAKKN